MFSKTHSSTLLKLYQLNFGHNRLPSKVITQPTQDNKHFTFPAGLFMQLYGVMAVIPLLLHVHGVESIYAFNSSLFLEFCKVFKNYLVLCSCGRAYT